MTKCSRCGLENGCCTLPDCPSTYGLGKPESVLSEAARLMDGDRQTAYGHPRDNHRCTAELWSSYLQRRFSGDDNWDHSIPLDAFDVCMLNILQKVSRLAHTRQRDGLVDIAGFARNAEMVDE